MTLSVTDAQASNTPARPWDFGPLIRMRPIDGRVWRYIDTGGQAPALVLLPGAVGICEMFFKQVATFAQHLRVIAVTYPGEPDAARLADGLAGLLDSIGLERASVLGSSFGGYWAQWFALRHAPRLQTLVLGNTFVTPDELFGHPLFDPAFIRGSSPEALQRVWRERVGQAPASELQTIQLDMLSGRQTAEDLKARFLGVITARPYPPLPIADTRIVVIDCADDPIIPPASRAAVRDRYPDAAHHTLTRGGHYPHILNTEAYNAVIAAHVQQ